MAKGRIRSAIKRKIRGNKIAKKVAKKVSGRTKKVKKAFEVLDAQLKLQRYKVRHFEPKIPLEFEKGHFTVKTVDTPAELEEVLKLRFEVFNREYMNTKRAVGVDVDKFDFICDHLMIRDNRVGQIVGTYRLNSSTFSDKYYSSGEFHFQKIKDLPGNILELGRAAIAKEYRTGVVIALLWRGISEYVQKSKADILIGCASVKTMEPLQIGLITYHLERKGMLTYDYDVQPTRKYKVKTLSKVLDYIEKNPFEYDEATVAEMIPPLFASYIKMGFKAYGEPAIDRDFYCIDYLIMIRMDEMDSAYRRRFSDNEKKL